MSQLLAITAETGGAPKIQIVGPHLRNVKITLGPAGKTDETDPGVAVCEGPIVQNCQIANSMQCTSLYSGIGICCYLAQKTR